MRHHRHRQPRPGGGLRADHPASAPAGQPYGGGDPGTPSLAPPRSCALRHLPAPHRRPGRHLQEVGGGRRSRSSPCRSAGPGCADQGPAHRRPVCGTLEDVFVSRTYGAVAAPRHGARAPAHRRPFTWEGGPDRRAGRVGDAAPPLRPRCGGHLPHRRGGGLLLLTVLALPAVTLANDTQVVLTGRGVRFAKSASIVMEREDLRLSPDEVRVAMCSAGTAGPAPISHRGRLPVAGTSTWAIFPRPRTPSTSVAVTATSSISA